MPAGHAGKLLRESPADPGRNANLSHVFDGADRHHSTESHRCPRRRSGGRATWNARADARIARTLGLVRRDAVSGFLSPGVSLAKPIAVRETQSLGRHDAGIGTPRETNQREAAQLFSLR